MNLSLCVSHTHTHTEAQRNHQKCKGKVISGMHAIEILFPPIVHNSRANFLKHFVRFTFIPKNSVCVRTKT